MFPILLERQRLTLSFSVFFFFQSHFRSSRRVLEESSTGGAGRILQNRQDPGRGAKEIASGLLEAKADDQQQLCVHQRHGHLRHRHLSRGRFFHPGRSGRREQRADGIHVSCRSCVPPAAPAAVPSADGLAGSCRRGPAAQRPGPPAAEERAEPAGRAAALGHNCQHLV